MLQMQFLNMLTVQQVTAVDAIENANLIFASYNPDKTLKSIDTKKVTLDKSGAYNDYPVSSSFVTTDNMKIMLWASDMATPICSPVVIGDSNKADTTSLFSKEDDGDNALLSLSSIKDSIVDDIVGLFADDSTVGTPQNLDTLVASMNGESSTLTSITGDKVAIQQSNQYSLTEQKYLKTVHTAIISTVILS